MNNFPPPNLPPLGASSPAAPAGGAAAFALPDPAAPLHPRLLLHAVEGWGKTTAAAHAPGAAILSVRESGYATLAQVGRVPAIPAATAETWGELIATLRAIVSGEALAGARTLAIDALSGAERLCHEYVCARDFGGNFGEKGFTSFQRGYAISLKEWAEFLALLDAVHSQRSMTILLLAHTAVKNFHNPSGHDFDRYVSDCHEKTWGMTAKWANAVLFGNFLTIVQKDGKSSRAKGTGGDDRVLYTTHTDAWDAKNQFGMPALLPIPADPARVWSTIWGAISARPALPAAPPANSPTTPPPPAAAPSAGMVPPPPPVR